MRNALRIVFLWIALLGMNGAFAQVAVLFSVDGWPQVTDRADRMIQAHSFTMGFANTTQGLGAEGTNRVVVQDSVLVVPVGDAALLFSNAALNVQRLRRVTVQFGPANPNTKAAPLFQANLLSVIVTSVTLTKTGSDGGVGAAEVKLRAAQIDLHNTNIDGKGAPRPGQKAGFDGGKALMR